MNTVIPHGTLLVKVQNEFRLYSVGDLQLVNELTIGQLFLAVANLYNKDKTEFGSAWPSFATKRNEFKVLEKMLASCKTDYEKLTNVCQHLMVAVPEIVENDKILL